MKLISTANKAPAVDPRSTNTPQPATDGSASDNGRQFDGVLADVGAEAKPAADATVKTAPATAGTAPATVGTAPDTVTLATQANGIIDALNGLLGQGGKAASAATAPADADAKPAVAAGTAGADTGSDVVGSLLKRIGGKDSTTPDPQTAAPAAVVPGAPSPDMMAALMMSAAVPPAPQATAGAAAGAPTATTSAKGALPGAITPKPASTSSDTSATTDPAEMVVSDVAVSTHLPPVQPVPNKTVLPGEGNPSNGPSGAHAHGDAHAGDQSADPTAGVSNVSLTPSLEPTFAPVPSIATAIANLAGPAAPAAPAAASAQNVPTDAPKSVLGIARTMTLQMNPAELGSVDIRLHMTGQTLDVQLTISDSRTLGIVNRERDTLASALHDKNYTLNSLVIQDGGASASSGGNNATQGDTSGSSARPDRQSGGPGADTPSGGRQGGASQRSDRDERRQPSEPVYRPPADNRGGSLYV